MTDRCGWCRRDIDLRVPGEHAECELERLRVLTPRRLGILDYIVSYVERARYPPTLREIGADQGLSLATVKQHIDVLVKAGIITRAPGSRTIHIAALPVVLAYNPEEAV